MKHRFVLSAIIIAALSISAASAPSILGQQRNSPAAVVYSRAASLQDVVNEAAHAALTKFADKKLTEAQLSITLIDLRDGSLHIRMRRGHHGVHVARFEFADEQIN